MTTIDQNPRVLELIDRLRPKRRQIRRFSYAEDQYILQKVEDAAGSPNWAEIARGMDSRFPQQVRERYNHYLHADVKIGQWTPEEDDLILKLYNELGPRWCDIANRIQGRTNIAVKNRYHVVSKRSSSIPKQIESKPAIFFPSLIDIDFTDPSVYLDEEYFQQ